ncbi:MAG: 16S rRNA (cytosine(1402)-N(4))-methyltransferase RsmH [Gemmatimonadota bacterium]
MESARGYHAPVLVDEVVRYLDPARGGRYFDGTLGGGGHTEAILSSGAAAEVIGVDQDAEALEVARRRLERFGDRVKLVRANFADAAESGHESLAGALLDLGVSSHQIDDAARGFSFRPGTPLDMRMSAATVGTAADLLNELPEAELATVFYRYGEERKSRRLAGMVVRRRAERPFRTSDDLNEVLDRFYGPRITVQDRARIYQALRVAVNDELDVLERTLPALRDRLEPAGVFVVLSYHSLEDRLVKDAFREWSRECVCPPELPVCRCRGRALGESLTRKPVMAGEAEVAANTRSRSARLRAWRKAA